MGSFNDFQWHLIFTILNPDQSYPFQKNIVNKVTLNIEAAFKQELQKQAYPSFSPKYIPVLAMF